MNLALFSFLIGNRSVRFSTCWSARIPSVPFVRAIHQFVCSDHVDEQSAKVTHRNRRKSHRPSARRHGHRRPSAAGRPFRYGPVQSSTPRAAAGAACGGLQRSGVHSLVRPAPRAFFRPEHGGMLDRIGAAEALSGRTGGARAETIRQPRDRLKGQPQERKHSAASWRDAGPTAPGKGCHCSQGWKPTWAETASAPFTTARPEGGRHAESPALRILWSSRRQARTGNETGKQSNSTVHMISVVLPAMVPARAARRLAGAIPKVGRIVGCGGGWSL